MAKYLVAGSAGFIGARVSELLLDAGHEVFGVDDLNDSYDVRLKQWRLQQLQRKPDFSFTQMNICDFDNLELLYKKQAPFDGVINLAARAGVRLSLEDPWVYVDTNVTGTLNLLELGRRYDSGKFVLASTSSIYGNDAPLPTPEDADSNHPLQPYAASKKGAEALCHSYHYLYDLDVTIFRYFTVYGPAGRPDMVMFRFVQWLAEGRAVHLNGDGEQKRGFTYIDDIARGTLLGLKPVGYELINLGGHEVISINEMLHTLEELVGSKAKLVYHPAHPADILANWADVSKAKRILGWQPQVGMDAGMGNLVDWYMRERDWARDILTP